MACPRYTVTPGSTTTPARFGAAITLAVVGEGDGFGAQRGTVSLICADGTSHSLPVTAWTDRLISATLLEPATACASPHQISVHIPTTPPQDCNEKIAIDQDASQGVLDKISSGSDAILVGVFFLGLIAVVSIFALSHIGSITSDPEDNSPLSHNPSSGSKEKTTDDNKPDTTQKKPDANPGQGDTGEQAATPAADTAKDVAASTGTIGLLGQISGVLGTIAAAAVGGIAGLLVRPSGQGSSGQGNP